MLVRLQASADINHRPKNEDDSQSQLGFFQIEQFGSGFGTHVFNCKLKARGLVYALARSLDAIVCVTAKYESSLVVMVVPDAVPLEFK